MGFTDVGLLRISESVRAYVYLILSSQASARSSIVGNTGSTLTAQSAVLNNFENVVNRRVDIREDIKRYQDTLSYASSKVDYSMRENVYMLPSNMNLKIKTGTVGYNNKILVSDGKSILGKNEKVNSLETPPRSGAQGPTIKNHKVTRTAFRPELRKRNSNDVLSNAPNISHKPQEPKIITHNDEKIALRYGIYFDKHYKFKYINSKYVN